MAAHSKINASGTSAVIHIGLAHELHRFDQSPSDVQIV
jgi:hypothetical protein